MNSKTFKTYSQLLCDGLFDVSDLKGHLNDLNSKYDISKFPISSYMNLFGNDHESRRKELATAILFRYLKNNGEIVPVTMGNLAKMMLDFSESLKTTTSRDIIKGTIKRAYEEIIGDSKLKRFGSNFGYKSDAIKKRTNELKKDELNWLETHKIIMDNEPENGSAEMTSLATLHDLVSDGYLEALPAMPQTLDPLLTVNVSNNVDTAIRNIMENNNRPISIYDLHDATDVRAFLVPTQKFLDMVAGYFSSANYCCSKII